MPFYVVENTETKAVNDLPQMSWVDLQKFLGDNPTYQQVSSETTGHAEAVEIIFDSKKITYEKMLDVFWHQIDPTTVDAQFVDVGNSYRTGIFYHNEDQKKLAEQSKIFWDKKGIFKKPIVTQIVAAGTFYKAEDYHQFYYKTNSIKYKFYRSRSGRDRYLKSIWGDRAR